MPIDIYWLVPERVTYIQTSTLVDTDDVLTINRHMLKALDQTDPERPVHVIGNATGLQTFDVLVPRGVRHSTYLTHPALGHVVLFGITGAAGILLQTTVRLSSVFTSHQVTLQRSYERAIEILTAADSTLSLPPIDPFA